MPESDTSGPRPYGLGMGAPRSQLVILGADDTLDGDDVLPGLKIGVASTFETFETPS